MKKSENNDIYGLTAAVLDGTKTQTRRIVTQKALEAWDDIDDGDEYSRSVYAASYEAKMRNFLLEYAQYKVGDVVAIAQKYSDNCNHLCHNCRHHGEVSCTNKMYVKASDMQWFIKITNVRVQRLQDISEHDCLAEGIIKYADGVYTYYENGKKYYHADLDTPQKAFADLIDKINGKGTWESNPFVFVYEFKLVKI